MKKEMTIEASSPLLILFLSQVKDHDMSFILNKKKEFDHKMTFSFIKSKLGDFSQIQPRIGIQV